MKPYKQTKNPTSFYLVGFFWRRVRDSNPGWVSPHSISSAAPSTTRTTLLIDLLRYSIKLLSCCQEISKKIVILHLIKKTDKLSVKLLISKESYMNNILLLISSMSANLFGGIIKKHINDRYENNMFSYQLYNCIVSIVSAVVLLIMSDDLSCSVFTVVTAIVFGLLTLSQQISNLLALKNGPFSYTTVIISLSTLIPTLSGQFFGDESLNLFQYAGIVLLVICFVLSVDFSGKKERVSPRWLVFSFIAFFCTGFIGVMQKIHQSSSHKNELDSFLIISFVFSFVCSLIWCLFSIKNRGSNKAESKKSILLLRPLFLIILSGVFVALNNKFNLYLSGVIPSIIIFPLVNGVGLILSILAALVVFKEKLNIKQKFGIIAGILSVLFLCINIWTKTR